MCGGVPAIKDKGQVVQHSGNDKQTVEIRKRLNTQLKVIYTVLFSGGKDLLRCLIIFQLGEKGRGP